MPELAQKYDVCFDFKPSPPSEGTMTQVMATTGLPYIAMNRIYYRVTAPTLVSAAEVERLMRDAVGRYEVAKERFKGIEVMPA